MPQLARVRDGRLRVYLAEIGVSAVALTRPASRLRLVMAAGRRSPESTGAGGMHRVHNSRREEA